MRIVADTNIIISALFWKQKLQIFFELINQQKIILCFSPETIDELYKITRYNHIAKKAEQEKFDPLPILDKLISNSIIVYPKFTIPIIAEDPSVNSILTCALAAQANFIISGDKHLLKLESLQGVPILTPKEFLQKYFKNPRLGS